MRRGVVSMTLILGLVGCGSSADETKPAPASIDAGSQAILQGTACSCDSECPAFDGHDGACVYGVCMVHASGACAAQGSTDECPAGSRCFSLANAPVCFPDCGDGKQCAGVCDIDGSCVHTSTTNCDSSCSTLCRTDDKLCAEKVPSGRCSDGAACSNGTCFSKGCPDFRCQGKDCLELIPMPGPRDPKSEEAIAKGYYLSADPKYSFLRRDLTMLIQYAACEVRYHFPDTAPLAISELSQKDGKTPGTDVRDPHHPTSTHLGDDLDIAYYQTDGANNMQIICGDGKDKGPNGYPGKYDDGYFCTTTENIIDWPRELWLFAKFSESPKARVYGIDQTLPDHFKTGSRELYESHQVNKDVFDRMGHVGYGASGGWQFHHHHSHMSFFP
jgi:hypothetical protein